MDTKEKIIQSATQMFNAKGYAAVTLHELAKNIGISRGNLIYHFKDKDILLKAITTQMWHKMEAERSKTRQFPSFENLHNEVQLYYKYQKEYAFIFSDAHVLSHQEIRHEFRKQIEQAIKDTKSAIAFAIQLGNVRPEIIKGTYHNIAMTVWMLTFFWLPQQIIRGKKTEEDGEKLIWSIMLPHMTDKGITSFKQFFGEKYLDELGEPFEVDIQSFVNF